MGIYKAMEGTFINKIHCKEYGITGKGETKVEALRDLFYKVCEIAGTSEGIKKIKSWQMQDEEGYGDIINELKKRL